MSELSSWCKDHGIPFSGKKKEVLLTFIKNLHRSDIRGLTWQPAVTNAEDVNAAKCPCGFVWVEYKRGGKLYHFTASKVGKSPRYQSCFATRTG
jgi:hypothetical protein